jgi:hypothetical protein
MDAVEFGMGLAAHGLHYRNVGIDGGSFAYVAALVQIMPRVSILGMLGLAGALVLVALTKTRSIWAQALAGLSLATLWRKGRGSGLVMLLVTLAGLVACAVLIERGAILHQLSGRFAQTFSSKRSSSVVIRFEEVRLVMRQIAAAPLGWLLGSGVGSTYSLALSGPHGIPQTVDVVDIAPISYLWQIGAVGLGLMTWLWWSMISELWRATRWGGRSRAVALEALVVLLPLLGAGLVSGLGSQLASVFVGVVGGVALRCASQRSMLAALPAGKVSAMEGGKD